MTKQPDSIDQQVRYALIHDVLPPPGACVCEIGVGGGWLLHYLHEEGYRVFGCDVSLHDFPKDSPIAHCVQQNRGTRLPYPDNHFDATYCCDVLEHVRPPGRAVFLAELVRITKPGGVVALTAFFKNTVSFRLWGVGYLFFRGTLPGWYTEHLTIPLPSEEATFVQLSQSLQGVRRVRYQRSLNLFIMWLQHIARRHRFLMRLPAMPRFPITRCDVIGRSTSAFFCGVKPECPANEVRLFAND